MTEVRAKTAPRVQSPGAHRLQDARVRELIAMRRSRYRVLSAIVSVVYTLVAAGCAFAPDLMRRSLAGTSISVGIVSMAVVIVVGILCSGYYTWWSNTVRDELSRHLTTPPPRTV